MITLVTVWMCLALATGEQQNSTANQDQTTKNYEEHRNMIEAIKSANTTWKPGYIFNPNISMSDMKCLFSVRNNSHGHGLPLKNYIIDETFIMPKSFDAREKWKNCSSIRKIYDQGSYPSGWAITLASVMADRLCIANVTTQVQLSVQQLMTCAKSCENQSNCRDSTKAAWDFFKNEGVVTGGDYKSNEGCQPYEVKPMEDENTNNLTPQCDRTYNFQCRPNCNIEEEKEREKAFGRRIHAESAYQVAPNEAAIQTDLMANGPVEAAFIVYTDFMYYSSGIYERTSGHKLGGHSVRLIGWGVENREPYWLVANSWGRKWGENGTFRIRRGTNECGIESYVTAGLPK